MVEYVTMIRNNVEVVVKNDKVEEFKKEGFKVLENEKLKQTNETEKPLKDMDVKELKALAEQKGIENSKNLTKAELLKVLAE